MENTCPFCNPTGIIIKESDYCRLVVNLNQSKNAEAFMVITKRHVAYIEDLTMEELDDFLSFWGECYIVLKKKFGRNLGNMLLNEGVFAGQNIAHVHGHIFVRSEQDTIVNMSRPDRFKITADEVSLLIEKSE